MSDAKSFGDVGRHAEQTEQELLSDLGEHYRLACASVEQQPNRLVGVALLARFICPYITRKLSGVLGPSDGNVCPPASNTLPMRGTLFLGRMCTDGLRDRPRTKPRNQRGRMRRTSPHRTTLSASPQRPRNAGRQPGQRRVSSRRSALTAALRRIDEASRRAL